jgi:hypothetical protein
MTDSVALTAVVAGRTIELREPTKAQVIMMYRASTVARMALERAQEAEKAKDEDTLKIGLDESLNGAGRLLDLIERFVTKGADRDWLVESLLEGTIDLEDLTPIMQAISEDPEKKATPAKPVKKAARGQ